MITNKEKYIFEKQAEVVKAIAHPLRIAILDFLADGEKCVCDIAEYVDSERSNVSKHLSVMQSVGLIEHRKDGLKVIYSLKAPCVLKCFSCISSVLKETIKENKKLLRVL